MNTKPRLNPRIYMVFHVRDSFDVLKQQNETRPHPITRQPCIKIYLNKSSNNYILTKY